MTAPPDVQAPEKWEYLATTNRGLEEVAIDEIARLTGSRPSISHPGMVRFTADERAIYRLHAHGRSIHRLLLELAQTTATTIESITETVHNLDVPQYLGPDQSFAVRAQRSGDHAFGSPDIEAAVGQAVIDSARERDGTRPPVDLEEPDLIFRLSLRDDTLSIAIDTTGQHSHHRRQYRVSEHDAALRPTIALAMLQYAGYTPSARLVDPMCGGGTIPIEAARIATGRPVIPTHEPAFTRFHFLEADRYERLLDAPATATTQPNISGYDVAAGAIDSAGENAREGDVAEILDLAVRDSTTGTFDADLIVTDMPFGIRTNSDLHALYRDFFETLGRSSWDRLVLHTARDDLVPLDASTAIPMRRGRLETTILVVESDE